MIQVTRYAQRLALGLFIVCVPLVYTAGTGNSLRVFQEQFFQVGGMCLVAMFVGNIWLTLFLLWNVILFYFHGATVGGEQCLNIFMGLMLFLVSRRYFAKSSFTEVVKPVSILAAITLTWTLLQFLRLDPLMLTQSAGGVIQGGPVTQPLGLFHMQAAHGFFLAIAAFICAMTAPWLGVLLLIPMALCKSSGVFLAVAVGILFYTYHLYKRVFLYILLLSIPLGSLLIATDMKTDTATFTSRFPMWHAAIRKTFEMPIGYGPDSFRKYHKNKNFTFNSDANQETGITYKKDGELRFVYYSMTNDIDKLARLTTETKKNGFKWGEFNFWDNPHNLYVTLFFELGIIGVLLGLGFFSDLISRFRNAVKDRETVTLATCLIIFFVASITQFPFHIARNAYLFPIILGGFFACTDPKNGGLA